MTRRACFVLLFSFVVGSLAAPLAAQEKTWQAGLAKLQITPPAPMWMSGYAARTKPAEGKINELWAKACLLESRAGTQVYLITLDLVGIDRLLSQKITGELSRRWKVRAENVMIACSHTHSGPVVGNNLRSMYSLDAEQQKLVDQYTEILQERIVQAVDRARRTLKPAKLSWSIGNCGFAVNRRNNKEAEIEKLRKENVALKGPVDHDVPVLAIRDEEGVLRGVVFGYACHATVLSGLDWCSDYPGFAMEKLEEDHKGAIALFWAGCGGDQNPLPRRSVALARKYGAELAAAVNETLKKPMKALAVADVTCLRKEIPLAFDELPTREQLAKDALSTNKYTAARAQLWLDRLAQGEKLPATYPYPIQAWKFGEELTWLALGGEVVVDYSLRFKKELGPGKTWVTAYANDVMAYIPSLRVLKEGGYEGGGAMLYYGQPGLWSAEVEETIVSGVHDLTKAKPRK